MADEIKLDIHAFKALASETRVAVLKKLAEKKRSPSSLAEEMGLSVQAVSEHLDKLREAGLVEKIAGGRKWVYFSLTEKGRGVVQPRPDKKILFLLGVSILAILAGAFGMLSQGSLASQPERGLYSQLASPAPELADAKAAVAPMAANVANVTAQAAAAISPEAAGQIMPPLQIILIVAGATLLAYCAREILKRR